MDLTPDETDDDSRTEAPPGELELQNLLDQLQAVQLQAPFESTRYKLWRSWSKTINYFHTQRALIAEACEYVAAKFDSDDKFRVQLFMFVLILKKNVGRREKLESVLEISKQWSILKPTIKKHVTSDKLDQITKDKMFEILFLMEQYEKHHPDIFYKRGDRKKLNIKDNDKKSKSIKTQTTKTRDEISRHKHSYSPGRTRDKKSRHEREFELQLYSPERRRQKNYHPIKKKHEKHRKERDSDSDSSDSSSSSDISLPESFSGFYK